VTKREKVLRARRAEWRSDPKLRALTEMILAMPVDERLRMIEANANFFLSVRPVDPPSTSPEGGEGRVRGRAHSRRRRAHRSG
jgi:hypothetical protein